MPDSTQRFSNRVDNYAKYRPGYPQGVIELLLDNGNLTADSVIADIGSGTGIFTELLLNERYTVYAVEPNDAMRNAADGSKARATQEKNDTAIEEGAAVPISNDSRKKQEAAPENAPGNSAIPDLPNLR